MIKNLILLILFGALFNTNSQWYQQNIPSGVNYLLSIDFSNTIHGAACGYLNFNGKAIYTDDSSTTWQFAQVPDSSRALITLQFLNNATGYIAGSYNSTVDNYTHKPFTLSPSINVCLSRIGLDTNSGYKGLFLKTTDGGVSWNTFGSLPDSAYYLIGMYFKNSSTGFVTADYNPQAGNSAILKTTNGGSSWVKIHIPDSINTLWKIYFVNDTRGFAVGYKNITEMTFLSVLLKSTDSGNTWSEMNFTGIDNLLDISFFNDNTGLITGAGYVNGLEHGFLLKTTDGGITWNEISSPVSNGVYKGVNLIKGTGTGFVFGRISSSISFIAKTNNYGLNWLNFSLLNFTKDMTDGAIADNNNWYICGGDFYSSAVILKTTNAGGPIGIKPVSNNIPNEYKLYQNYPNPFNPVTKIKFDVGPPLSSPPSQGGDRGVVLKIYDVLGREIAVLVNEKLTPGTYEVEWIASNYPSGLYFYRLQTEYYSEVKKMVFIK
jgi:photosystem II stability/assembly factor-like uncharacterized protein